MSIMVVLCADKWIVKAIFVHQPKFDGWRRVKNSLSDIVPVQVKNKYPSNKKIEDEAEKVRRMLLLRGSERIFHWPKIEAKPENKLEEYCSCALQAITIKRVRKTLKARNMFEKRSPRRLTR